ncbi:MAG: hypothetical protein GKR90_13645 [Pseudomonadales bacterium]|nr:hypothetical protein [Pseudomonadales bacterium]
MSANINSETVLGPWRRPKNTSADEKGGIHDDDTAQDLGFQGGTIAGSIHMEQFPPLLVQHFGDAWWSQGGMSLYFKAATIDHEPVCCKLEPTGETTARIWMENEAGTVVMEGSASLGEDENSEVSRRIEAVRPPTDLRMMADVVINEPSPPCPVRVPQKSIDERLAVITEPMTCYTDETLYGGNVAPIAPFVHAFREVEPHIIPVRGPYVGLFGSIEVQYLAGPIVAERDYVAQGHVVALSDSPKTEIIWYTATLSDPSSGEKIARMTKMDRLMKDASPLWSDA